MVCGCPRQAPSCRARQLHGLYSGEYVIMCAKIPKYIELYSGLRQKILRGEYPVDSYLPTENELVEQYQVSKTTVRHAVKMLRDHGMVEVKQGAGTKVLPLKQEAILGEKYNAPDSTTAVRIRYMTRGDGEVRNTEPVIDVIPATDTIAEALKIASGEPVYRLQRLQLVDEVPFGYMVNYIAEKLVPGLSSKEVPIVNLYGYLSSSYGITVTNIEEVVDAITAGFMEAQYLQTEVGTPLLLLRRIADADGLPVEYCETTARPDIFHMTVKISPVQTAEAGPFLS